LLDRGEEQANQTGRRIGEELAPPGMTRLLAMIDAREIQAVIVAKLDRLTRSGERCVRAAGSFERHGVTLISVANRWTRVLPWVGSC